MVCGDGESEAGGEKDVKRQAGGHGRKTGKSTEEPGERNRDSEQNPKSPERVEEKERRTDTRKVETGNGASGKHFAYHGR